MAGELTATKLKSGTRLRSGRISTRSALSATFGLVILGCLVLAALRMDWSSTFTTLETANAALVLAALGMFYLGFLGRSRRWQVLLENIGWSHRSSPSVPGYRGLTAIMYRGWLVNTITIARAGDAYRVVQLRLTGNVPLAQSTGTLVTERLIDLAVLGVLLVPAILLSFHHALPELARWALAIAALFALLGPAVLFSVRRVGPAATRIAPARFAASIEQLTDGVAGSVARCPLLLGLTAFGWFAESAMVLLAARAVGVRLPLYQAAMLALTTALLSTIPITPGGLGVADAGIVLLLGQIGFDRGTATAIAVIVRAISLGSVVIGGGIVGIVGSIQELDLLQRRKKRQWV